MKAKTPLRRHCRNAVCVPDTRFSTQLPGDWVVIGGSVVLISKSSFGIPYVSFSSVLVGVCMSIVRL
jgi:hypothetical protein